MNKPNFILLFVLIALLLMSQTTVSRAAQSIVLSDEVQMRIGNAFMAEGDYYRAITEYKKLTFLFPASELLPDALYQIGMAYYMGKDYETGAKSFAKVRQAYSASNFSSAAFYEGLCYEKLGQYDAAALAYERARLFDINHQDAANAQIGLVLNAAAQGNTVKAQFELNDFQINYPEDNRSPGIQKSLSLLSAYDESPKKSSVLAGTMSAIIPGSGQMYAEHYKDGLMAFVVNGLFIAGTIAAVDSENYALAAIVGGVGMPFYIGNIYGASNAARRWNVSLTRQLHNDLSMTLNFHY